MAPEQRIPFEEAIGEPLLFQAGFASLSLPQQVVLKAIYGLPLRGREFEIWNAMNGKGRFDSLGFLIGLEEAEVPYPGEEMEDVTLIVGRRAGKSERISSFVVAYEALCGGHKQFVGSRQDPIFLQVAQDLATAKSNLRQFILKWLEESPIGKKELGDVKKTVTADSIRLKRGLITVGPPTIKLRSQAIAVCAADELAVWPKDRESANPDLEVERAVRPAMMQFPFRKFVKTSTPWTEEGLLWEAAQVGTQGAFLEVAQRATYRKFMVLRGPTALFENPRANRAYLKKEREKDPEAFRREYLAEFSKSISGFLNPDLLRASISTGLRRRPPKGGVLYVATLDPAFRRDAFAFSLSHLEEGKFVVDLCESWSGTAASPLDPRTALAAVASLARTYGTRLVTSDQYHLESLQSLAQEMDLVIEPLILTAQVKSQMWGEFASMLSQGKIVLPEDPELVEQLMKMEKRLTPMGNVQYAGGSAHDDKAMVVALGLHRALQYGERLPVKVVHGPVTHAEMFWDSMRKREKGQATPWWA